MEKNLKVKVQDKIAIITLTNSENYNPLNQETAIELLNSLLNLKSNQEIRCVIITGSGKAFSAGGDVKKFKQSVEDGTPGKLMDDLTKDLYQIARELRLYPKPVIAAVNGWAVGAGMNLALSCDLVIASERAKFRQSFSNLALIPGFAGSILLSRQLTWQQATEMAFFGDTYNAQEMKNLGLVNEVVVPNELKVKALEWAKRLAEGPTLTYARTKKLFYDALSTSLDKHLEEERQMQIKSAETEDYKIGVNAILSKSNPKFIGK
ncbi:MAG: enoyl-CoA hydratase/isomerase family protein [Promethearchaeota archaeon]|nr:MAG: enoyl-CoA hydratase/isomerase family protein [Candidatus Lokiarchaeota archaeon]